MKKILLIVLLIFATILTSCGYSGYSGDRLDLFSVAVNSVLFVNGYSWGADFACDPHIEIIDEDSYGKTMFLYREDYYKGSDISFSALIVCQGSNEKEVFYYEDVNYIVKEQEPYTATSIERFTIDEIEYLKSVNDWNKEIDYDRCIRKEIVKTKEKIPDEEKIQELIVDNFALVKGEYSLFVDFLTANADQTKYIIYGHIRYTRTDQEGICFIGLVENGDFIELSALTLSDAYDYKAEFVEFKKSNKWY